MKKRIADPEVRKLAACAALIQEDYAGEDVDWNGSPFAWIRYLPSSRKKGAAAEKLVAAWLAGKGFNVARSPDAEADRVIEDQRAEIKFSTLWASGVYKFQQLRDQNYDFAICLGVSPFDAHCWVLPKREILKRWRARDGIVSQHGGRAGTDTAWLSVSPGDPPAWLSKFDGRMRAALKLIEKHTGYTIK